MKGNFRKVLKHYTSIFLTVALIFGQIVPVSATELLSDENTPKYNDELFDELSEEADEELLYEDLTEESLPDDPEALSEEIVSDNEVLSEELLFEGNEILAEETDMLAETAEGTVGGSMYTLEAGLLSSNTRSYPGVYTVKALSENMVGADMTIGIPSLNDDITLKDGPTIESPAIIMGAAVPYEKKVGPVDFEQLEGGELYAPYSKFRYEIIEEANLNGTGTHKKMSGFDGTYFIIRVDVSDIVSGNNGKVLHVKQSNNKALMVKSGSTLAEGLAMFSDAQGTQTGSYLISDNKLVARDAEGAFTECSYIDVIFMSSGTLVQGADTGGQPADAKAPTADFPLSFYIDDIKDYNPDIEWNQSLLTAVYTTTGKAVELTPAQTQAGITAADLMLEKYYDEKEAAKYSAKISKYTVKGKDVEIEEMVEGSNPDPRAGENEYWSLKKAMESDKYNEIPIKLICEAPLLNQISVSGSKNTILDVNSFDIQLANHQSTDAAALKVTDGAVLEITDSFETTGAELAVGNNATMEISGAGSKLIVSEKAQLEVEYDAASVSAGSAEKPTYNNGVITVKDGGTIVNRGVITVEGKEGKPQNPADAGTVIRDFKDAVLTIGEGGTLENYGCVLMNGQLYNFGTIINKGKYTEKITSYDPDKGSFTYHKGIQLSWKDDITQGVTNPGALYNGIDDDGNIWGAAEIINSGDIVLVPGYLVNSATLTNETDGNIYMCAVDEIVIPIAPFADKPLITEQRINLGYGENSWFINNTKAVMNNKGHIMAAQVDIVNNGRTGDNLETGKESVKYRDMLYIVNDGNLFNSDDGEVALDSVYTLGLVKNTHNGKIERVVLEGVSGQFEDVGNVKTSDVFNASKMEMGSTDLWLYAPMDSLTVSKDYKQQSADPEDTVKWKVTANSEQPGENVRYLLHIIGDNIDYDQGPIELDANTESTITSKKLPDMKGNAVFSFYSIDKSDYAVVKINGTGLIRPTAMQGPADDYLVYNGKEQQLVTPGSIRGGKVQYKLGEGEFSDAIPTAKNAGEYLVTYRTVMDDGSIIEGEDISVAILRRNAYIAADDKVSVKGENRKDLSYVSYGFLKEDNVQVELNTDANLSEVGTYSITVSCNAGDNYNIDEHIYNGLYHVVEAMGDITDMSTQSVLTAYDSATNLSHSISVNITYNGNVDESKKAVIYYSLSSDQMTPDNYKTIGTTVAPQYGGISDDPVSMQFYINNPGGDDIIGAKQVVVVKGEQETPKGIETMGGLVGQGGVVIGLVPFDSNHNSMEYRRADETTYTRVLSKLRYLPAGDYVVRYAGNERLNPSPDLAFAITEDKTVNVDFYSYGGTKPEPKSGLIFGDMINEVSVRPGYDFEGWFNDSGYTEKFEYVNSIANGTDLRLHAKWKFKNENAGVDDKDKEYFGKDTDKAEVKVDPDNGKVTVSDADISVITDDEDGKLTVDSKLWVGGLKNEYIYTGAGIRPEIHVYDGVKKLIEKTDYTLSFKNNINVGKIGDMKNGKSIAPTVTVKFKGNYNGNETQNIEFNIVPADLGKEIEVHDISVEAKKNNKEQKPVPLIIRKDTGKKLDKKFFTISYNGAVTASGNYIVYVSAKDINYKGSVSANVKVVNDKKLMLEKANVKIDPYTYTGEPIIPGASAIKKFVIGANPLTFNTDYEIENVYNNTEPGTATVIFRAKPGNKNDYVGTKQVTFQIKKGRILTNSRAGDFSYSYPVETEYVKSGAKPEITVKDRDVTLTEGKDYTVSYKNNKAIASSNAVNKSGKDAAPQIIVKGKGKYKGSVTLKFSIVKRDIGKLDISADDLFITKTVYVNGNYKKTKITILNTDGKKLGSKDYAIDGEPEITGDGETGVTVSVNVIGTGDHYTGGNTVSFRLMNADSDISKASLNRSIVPQEYTGREVKLSRNDVKELLYTGKRNDPQYLHYKDGDHPDDFEIVSYINNINKGTATVIVRGVGRFAGTKTIKFKIKQKKAEYQGALIDDIFRKFVQ